MNNRYNVLDGRTGRQIYEIREETDCCTRGCWGGNRPFTAVMYDYAGNQIVFERSVGGWVRGHFVSPFGLGGNFYTLQLL
jgi:hypothetical protein